MKRAEEMQNLLERYPHCQGALYSRGYLISSRLFSTKELESYPFYSNWKTATLGSMRDGKTLYVYCHYLQDYHSYSEPGLDICIVGHAYNPFNLQYNEQEILQDCLLAYRDSRRQFFDKVSELTGIHLIVVNDNGTLLVLQDCAGMKSCYYGVVAGELNLTSHPQLVADLYGLEVDATIERLRDKWFFSIGVKYLPGDLSPFDELKRLGPNTYVAYSNEGLEMKRFFPREEHPVLAEEDYDAAIDRISELLHNNIALCSKKWMHPAISLSGGMDSKTTLACANGIYDKFRYYSFHCKPQELEDAKAAREICQTIGVGHTIYAIPEKNEEIEDFDVLERIVAHNSSYVGIPPSHETRKFAFLHKLKDFDVELKSWISEIGRAMWGRRYGLEMPEILTPRHFSIFQTRYLGSPSLLRHADHAYGDYLGRIQLDKPLYNYEHADSFYWEFRWGSWGTNVVTTQDIFSHTVTMPMNNRKLIDMFLWFPHDYRKRDMVHRQVIKRTNQRIAELDIDVHNNYLRGKRVLVEKTYYYFRTLPLSIKDRVTRSGR